MKLAVFHYHLQPGGVTDVIVDSVRALCSHNAADKTAVHSVRLVCGRQDNAQTVVERIRSGVPAGITVSADVQPLLDYTPADEETTRAHERAAAIEEWLRQTYAGFTWWIHNYHLGKNPAFTLAVCRIAADQSRAEGGAGKESGAPGGRGEPESILLHIHDFPESARYENLAYLRRITGDAPYPDAPHVRYATINTADHAALMRAGVPEDRCGLLLNPLPGGNASTSRKRVGRSSLVRGLRSFAADEGFRFNEDGPLLLYPVRTIRRKNVLEMAALSRLIPHANLVVTLPGTSEAERAYSDMISFAYHDGRVSGIWGIGRREEAYGLSFEAITTGCDVIVSSSVQEGFGLTFVNALLWRKPLVARRLPVLDGIDALFAGYPASFYDAFTVPARSPSITSMGAYLSMRYQERLEAIGDALPPELREPLEAQIDRIVSRETLEFSFLPAQMQLTVLGDLKDEGFASYVRALNGDIVTALQDAIAASAVPAPDMSEALERELGYESYARQLLPLLTPPPNGPTAAESHGRLEQVQAKLTHEFASLDRLRLLLGPLDHEAHG